MRQIIHIPEKKINVINHLKNQTNMSGYVVKLIERDLENSSLTKEDIIELIKKYSGNNMEIDLLESITDTLDF